MVKNFEKLVLLCNEELIHREYKTDYCIKIREEWNKLRHWLQNKKITEFSEELGKEYCDETFGTHLMLKHPTPKLKIRFRAIRMLISYQKNGEFEFRCPRVEYIFSGIIGDTFLSYLDYCRTEFTLAKETIEDKKRHLYHFYKYMNIKQLDFDNISIEEIENFFTLQDYTLYRRHRTAKYIKAFLKFVYDIGKSKKDMSIFVLQDNYRKNRKLPTTYEEEEIKKLISSVERASAIGKRDYLILLLAAEYGWRASDITKFTFNHIDWDKNIIQFEQYKTKVPVEFPLLSTVGNAIIDYLKHARPITDVPEIIVSFKDINKGKPLSSSTIHSIVTKYMKFAKIKDWQNKKHGPHALRHSLATNLLKKNTSLPVIKTILGHQNSESTKLYISLDYNQLKKCVLPMPKVHSFFYKKEGEENGKI